MWFPASGIQRGTLEEWSDKQACLSRLVCKPWSTASRSTTWNASPAWLSGFWRHCATPSVISDQVDNPPRPNTRHSAGDALRCGMLYHSASFSVKENNFLSEQGVRGMWLLEPLGVQLGDVRVGAPLDIYCTALAHLSQELRTYCGTLTTFRTTGEYFNGNEVRSSVHLLFEDRKEATPFFRKLCSLPFTVIKVGTRLTARCESSFDLHVRLFYSLPPVRKERRVC